MDKKQTIHSFLESGILLSPSVADKINRDNQEKILRLAKQSGDLVVTDIRESALLIRVKKIREKSRLSVQDFVKYYNSKYSGIKDILSKKMNATSINNAKQAFSEVSVIGMVKELTPRGFIMEDTTDEISVISPPTNLQVNKQVSPQSKQLVSVDDVIGVTGFVKEGSLFAREIISPDIPLDTKPGRIDANILLTTRMTDAAKASTQDVNFVLIPELSDNPNPKRIISGFGNPAWITMSKGDTKVMVLVYCPGEEAGPQQAIDWLKKRHLCPRKESIRSTDDPFMIDPVPAVFWLVQEKEWSENYKGVNIISCSRGSFAKTNLWSMETKFYPHEKQI